MSRPIDLICMGRVAVDLYAEQIHSPLSEAQSFRCYLGGCAGNIAVGTARQGLKSAMFSYIGTDDMGQFLLKTLEKENVDTSLLKQTADHLTGLVILGVDPPDRFPLIFFRENCADMQIQPEDCDETFFKKAKALLITGTGLSKPSIRKATQHALALARECGVKVVMDLDYRPVLWGLVSKGEGESRYQASSSVTAYYQAALPYCDLIVGTEEEILIAGGVEDLEKALNNIRRLSSAPIVLKQGEKGCAVYLDNFTKPIIGNAYPVKVLNVLGAGDAFMSGFLHGWLRDESWETCATYGNACGALVVTRHGCAPAIPSDAEKQFFIKHFKENPDILSSPSIARLHRDAVLGNPADETLLILAFDHRWQFEEEVKKAGKNIDLIREYKQQIFSGFCEVKKIIEQEGLGILVDPHYGDRILSMASHENILVGVPIEAAGVTPLTWLSDKSAYEEILTRPKEWFVKVLWEYHPSMSADLKKIQLEKLTELTKTCDSLERKLMVELILPKPWVHEGASVARSIRDVYENNLYPYWWKIAGFETQEEWTEVSSTIKEFDQNARIIMLGGASKDINIYQQQFKMAKATDMVSGFAVGRSIFWEPWLDLIGNKITMKDVSKIIAERYSQIIRIWKKS